MTWILVLAPAAVDDLQTAVAFYELQRPGLAAAFLRALDDGLARVVSHPLSFQADDHGVRTGFLCRFPYGVRFDLKGDRIQILAVWHERRHPDGWRARDADDREPR